MAVKGFGAASFAGYLLVSNGTGSLAATIISRWLPSPRTDRLSLRRAGAIAAPLIMSTIVLQASARFLEIIAGFQLGNKAAGHARIATQIAESVSSILFPSLDTYVIAKGNATGARLRDAQRRIYEQMLLTAPFVSVFLFSAVAAAVPTFVLLVLGPDWYPAIVPAMILCCIGLPYSLDMPMRALLKSRGDMTPVLRIVLLSSSATAVLVALGAAVSLTLAATGAVGAAAVAAAYSTRAAVAGLGVSRRDIANAALRCFLCLSLALASSLLVLWLLPPDPSRLLAIFAGGALTVLLSAIAVGTVVPKASPLRMILSGLVRRANY
jgi:O-antigen/teichoic acid export membrane protein